MNNDFFSIILQCQHTTQQGITQLQVVRVDTAEIIPINDCSFLVRFSRNKKGVERYIIRHLTSGREAYLQSGSNFSTFIKDCALHIDELESTNPNTQEE